MCGVVGIQAQGAVNQQLYDALTVLQHRGQDAAGILTTEQGQFYQQKGVGLVRNVFSNRHMQQLVGRAGVAHCRYPTAGSSGPALSQPFYVNSPYGIALAHNGNLTNSEELRDQLFSQDRRHLNTDSDSEILLNIFANELASRDRLHLAPEDIFAAVSGIHARCRGAYACVGMIADHGMVAFRDPNGIRPLVFGTRVREQKTEYMIASESSALSVLGFDVVRDVAPGEAIFIDQDDNFYSHQCAENPKLTPCIFEHVYFARPDSSMDNIHMYKTRLRQGVKLAEKILREWSNHDIDVVVPIPDTSRVAAQALAETLGIRLREGLMKNRYIGRTFIMPGQAARKKSVRQKLNAIEPEFDGRNVLLIDDSIVRGTTSRQIVEMVREAGANKVYFASAAPPVRFPNVYGIDMPSADELIAHGRTEEEVAALIGANRLIYQDLDDLISASLEGNPEVDGFECSVFTGEYISGDVDGAYLSKIDKLRNDEARSKDNTDESSVVGLHNSRQGAV